MKKKIQQNRVKEFNEKVEEIEELLNKKMIDKKIAKEKYDILKKKYEDLEEKDKEIKIKKTEFFEILGKILNNLLLEKRYFIKKFSKFITNQEIKYGLEYYTPNLNFINGKRLDGSESPEELKELFK